MEEASDGIHRPDPTSELDLERGSPARFSTGGLRRIVPLTRRFAPLVILAAVMAWSSAAFASTPVPATERTKIVAQLGSTYLPTWLPPGYIFTQWQTQAEAHAFGTDLVVSFGRDGDLVQWTVGDARDPNLYAHDVCYGHSFMPRYFTFDGRRVTYNPGNDGDAATACFKAPGGVVVGVTAWNDHRLSPATMAKLVGEATLVK
jgi:hypothetical protein